MNHLSVSTYINIVLYDTKHCNTVDVICITNTRHQKWKQNVKKEFIFIYRYNDSCIDNEEAAIWLLYGSLAYTLMNGYKIFMAFSISVMFIVQYWKHCHIKKKPPRTFLVAQRLGIRLPMQGMRVRALVRKDPTCHGATKPVRHNYWACALEPASHSYWACVPQLLKPARLELVLHNKRSHHNERPAHRIEE